MKDIYDFQVKTIDGQIETLEAYRGRVLLIVNVASKCGLTPQYAELEALYRQYRDRGLRWIAANLDEPDDRESTLAQFPDAAAPLLMFPDATSVTAWHAFQLPTLYIVGTDGRISSGHTALADEPTLQSEIEAALAKPPASPGS